MAEEPLDNIRLAFMQDLLPVGLAIVERARKGGVGKLFEVFTESSDPFQELRSEGESSASSLREKLDQVSPGLGNPVMSVKVDVSDESSQSSNKDDDELRHVLIRIEKNIDALNRYFGDNESDSDINLSE